MFSRTPTLALFLLVACSSSSSDAEPPESCPAGRHPAVVCVEGTETDGCARSEGACIAPCTPDQTKSKYCEGTRAREACGLGDFQPIGAAGYCFKEQ